MTPRSETPQHLPMPLPPGGPAPAHLSLLARLLRYRFFLVALVIILFLAALFAWKSVRPGHHPAAEAQPLAAQGEAGVLEQGKEPLPLSPAPEGKSAKLEGKLSEAEGKLPPPEGKFPEAEGKSPEASPAVPETLAPVAVPPVAQVIPPPEPAKGVIFTRALIKIMNDQLNRTWFGWRPNSLLFGKFHLTHNVNNIQEGVLEVARRTVEVLNLNMTRFATTEAYNPQVNEAMNYFMVSSDKYWFPSASGKYREALGDLQTYIDDLQRGRSRFYTRVDYLIILLGNYKDILGSSFHNLIKDTEDDGKPVGWWASGAYFYHAQGIALGMADMLEAVDQEFKPELQKKDSHKLLEDAIHSLQAASRLSPWVLTNASKDGILANHRADMSTYIGDAEHILSTLQSSLASN